MDRNVSGRKTKENCAEVEMWHGLLQAKKEKKGSNEPKMGYQVRQQRSEGERRKVESVLVRLHLNKKD